MAMKDQSTENEKEEMRNSSGYEDAEESEGTDPGSPDRAPKKQKSFQKSDGVYSVEDMERITKAYDTMMGILETKIKSMEETFLPKNQESKIHHTLPPNAKISMLERSTTEQLFEIFEQALTSKSKKYNYHDLTNAWGILFSNLYLSSWELYNEMESGIHRIDEDKERMLREFIKKDCAAGGIFTLNVIQKGGMIDRSALIMIADIKDFAGLERDGKPAIHMLMKACDKIIRPALIQKAGKYMLSQIFDRDGIPVVFTILSLDNLNIDDLEAIEKVFTWDDLETVMAKNRMGRTARDAFIEISTRMRSNIALKQGSDVDPKLTAKKEFIGEKPAQPVKNENFSVDILRATPGAQPAPFVPKAPVIPKTPAPGAAPVAPKTPAPGTPHVAPKTPAPGAPQVAPKTPTPGAPQVAPKTPAPNAAPVAPKTSVPGTPSVAPKTPAPGAAPATPKTPVPDTAPVKTDTTDSPKKDTSLKIDPRDTPDKKMTVMIVDDDEGVRVLLQEQLKDLGYEKCITATNGYDAINLARETKPHLVFMDISMPGKVDGIAAANTIKKLLNSRIIFLSDNSDEGTFARAKEVNPDGYIVKPYTDKDLRKTLHSLK